MKRKISCLLALFMSFMCTAPSVSFADNIEPAAAQDGYVIDLGDEVEFNRVQLMWNEAQSGDVTVTAGETTLSGTADGTVLNLFNSSVSNDAVQVFTRENISASSITVNSDTEPIVRLYKDENLQSHISSKSSDLNNYDRLFDGTNGTASGTNTNGYASDLPNTADTTTERSRYASATFDASYDISEFVMYTWGNSGWYPQSYTITAGGDKKTVTTLNPTANGNNYPSKQPYVIKTPIATSADGLTITFHKGGWSDARDIENSTKTAFYGFRIFEIELYGSSSPVWTDDKSDAIKTYTFASDDVGDAEKINITCGNADGGALVKINDGKLTAVALKNGVGTVALPDNAKTQGVTVGVMRVGDTYPGVELAKSVVLDSSTFTSADNGKRVVPDYYKEGKTRNGQETLNTSSNNNAAYYKGLFDASGTQTVSDKEYDFLGKRVLFYWDKYVKYDTESDQNKNVIPSDGTFTDCYGYFTIDTLKSQRITKVELFMQNGSQSASDKIFVTDDMSDYGSEFDVSISDAVKYAVDENTYDKTATNIKAPDARVMTATPNKTGRYVKALLYGYPSTGGNVVVIFELKVTADDVITSKPETSALPAHVFDLGGEKTFNRAQLIWDEEQTGNVWVDLQNGDNTVKEFTTRAENDTEITLYDSSVTDSSNVQTFTRSEYTADKVIVYSESKPDIRLYNDINVLLKTNGKTSDIKKETFAGYDALFDGSKAVNSGTLQYNKVSSKDKVVSASVSGTLDADYNISEFVLYTWGPDGWYPVSYEITTGSTTINGTAPIEPDLTKNNVTQIYPQYKPYILTTALNTAGSSFAITFPKGGWADTQNYEENKTAAYGFRLYELEMYGSAAPVYVSEEFKDYTFTAEQVKAADKINIISDNGASSTLVKVNDGSPAVAAFTNGIASIAIPDGAENGITISVAKAGESFPEAECVKSRILTLDEVSLADGGKKVVSTEYNAAAPNGTAMLVDKAVDDSAYGALFDKDTAEYIEGTNTAEKTFLGKKAYVAWDKYTSSIPADDYTYSDCYGWFTIDMGDTYTVSDVDLYIMDAGQSDKSKVYVTDSVDAAITGLTSSDWTNDTLSVPAELIEEKYGKGSGVTVSDAVSYAYDSGRYGLNASKAEARNIRKLTATTNKSGRYVTALLYGGSNNTQKHSWIFEMVITVDEPVLTEYETDLKETVDFNRVKLEWDNAQTGTVTADIVKNGETVQTLTARADRNTSLNLFDGSIGQTVTDLDGTHTVNSQNFTRKEMQADKIIVHAKEEPVVKLYNDININQKGKITAKSPASNFNTAPNMFDGKNEFGTNYGFYNTTTSSDKVSSSVSADLDKTYDISEFVLYTWGIDKWYPVKYSIKIGDTETDGTATLEGVNHPYNPYVLTTAVNAASDKITVTVPEGGYATNNSTIYNGFRIYEAEFYGAVAPVWASDGSDVITKEATPEIGIDYDKEQLTGFTAGEKYTITYENDEGTQTITKTDEKTAIDIPDDIIGKTISVVKNGDDNLNYDSEAQPLPIPSRAATPTAGEDNDFTVTQPTAYGISGKITAKVNDTLEYKLGSESWKSLTTDGIEAAQGSKVYIRAKYVSEGENKSLHSDSTEVTIDSVAQQFTVSLDTNGGDSVDNLTGAYNSTVTLPTPKRTGYTFTGWKLDDDNTYEAGEYTVTDNVTLTAQWNKDNYQITYNNTKTADTSQWTNSYTVDAAVTLPENPTADGFTFVGWYTDAELQTEASNITSGTTGDKTFYAKWKTATPSISIDFVNETLTGFGAGTYTISDGSDYNKSFTFTAEDETKTVSIEEEDLFGKTLSITKKGNDAATTDSDAQTGLAVAARPTIDALTIDNASEKVTIPAQYSYGTAENNLATSTTGSTDVTVAPEATLYYRKNAVAGTSFASAVMSVTAPARADKPTIAINYTAETLGTAATMQYFDGENWVNCMADMAVSTEAFAYGDGSAAKTVSFRTKATDEKYASETLAFEIPARPAAIANEKISTTQASSKTAADGKITIDESVVGSLQLKASEGDWAAATSPMTVKAGSYQVRLAATSSAFASIPANVTVSADGSHAIRFLNNDGTTILDTQILDNGSEVTYGGNTPSVITDADHDDGYNWTFTGWDSELTAVSGDKDYTATYTKGAAKTYTITLITGDGKVKDAVADNYKTYTYNPSGTNQLPSADEMEYAGHTLTTWKMNDGTEVTAIPAGMKGDRTFTAVWGTEQYTVTKTAAQNGSYEIATLGAENKVDYDTTITITSSPDAGYEIDKIYTYPTSGSRTELTKTGDSYTYTVQADTTVEVTFKAIEYLITLHANGGEYAVGYTAPSKYTINDTVTLPSSENISKEGYTFVGWYAVNDLSGESVTTIASGSTGAKEYWAKWNEITPDNFTIQFNNNAHGIKPADVTQASGTTIDLTAPAYLLTDNDYDFGGWYTDSELQNKAADSYSVTANATLYAKWTEKQTVTYTITWKNWNGDVLATTEVAEGATPTYPNDAPAPTKTSDIEYDYIFDKWTPNLAKATAAAEYTATYTSVAKEAPKTFLDLLEGFSSWLKIEKTNAAESSDVVLMVSKDENSQNEIPALKAYIAVYDGGALQSVKPYSFTSNAVTLPAAEATGNYKIFIWTDKYEPVIEAITSTTEGSNKLFE